MLKWVEMGAPDHSRLYIFSTLILYDNCIKCNIPIKCNALIQNYLRNVN
jgi:hypothetical protein